ncbi:Phospho-N-acetylmuramoyl-pentapeptide-transferase [Moraxella cuniculi DSM 21768]|uniref:Phospho-N-acetylmuramoyl-pentapeptide-transferase n=2 Tax=Moraxella cuniculi TaxID=34061 RepID=A0A1N7DPX1_9GAMM|nr:phospho-N-acetylmuramoyl-pentapeptide-transferase [Moraxella cuniculi]OOS05986.1 phospho-N-acetylmuramoyl-pentapeptide-transferase [Moraxella cuniculi]SIR77932.1 Phospho-N-acetylmuramoyl-pentapeptide-transferase [Moraxella cuniculi DSM 21768]VEG12708.1 Phospho-N-acetylmuramoyl-pentapeptide-transferase [Moraxella cuniculi]
MLYWLLQQTDIAIASVTLRALLAVMTALCIVIIAGKPVINYLRTLKYGQAVRDDGPKTHLAKQGTPTMGGVLILVAIGIATLAWADLSNPYVWILMVVMVVFGAVGWADDWLKIKHKNPQGLIARKKYFWLSLGSLFAGVSMYYIATQQDATTLAAMQDMLIPLFKGVVIPFSAIPLGLGFIIATYFVLAGSSNAVNLTDGLDGLVILPVVLVAAGLGVFAYISGSANYAAYMHVPHIIYNTEVVIVCASIIGAGLGFLWYNAAPADVFMGDVGALSLGGMLGTIAVMTRQELAFAIMGGIFVAEAVSVILQVGSYRLRKKRIFLMAPLHHHFEEMGLKETKVVARFYIVCIILVILGLMTLKLR